MTLPENELLSGGVLGELELERLSLQGEGSNMMMMMIGLNKPKEEDHVLVLRIGDSHLLLEQLSHWDHHLQ